MLLLASEICTRLGGTFDKIVVKFCWMELVLRSSVRIVTCEGLYDLNLNNEVKLL